MVFDGVLAIKSPKYTDGKDVNTLITNLEGQADELKGFPLILVVDDSEFVARTLNNFLWVTFTRTNPSHDIRGVHEFTENKHWGAKTAIIFDARIKPHHAPPLVKDPKVEKRVDELGSRGGSLHGII